MAPSIPFIGDFRSSVYPLLIIRPHYIIAWDDGSNENLVLNARSNPFLKLILCRRHIGAAQTILCVHGLHCVYSPVRQHLNTVVLF